MGKRKVAIVSSLDNRGGTELSLLNLLKSLNKNDCDVTLFLLAWTDELLSEVPNWVSIQYVKAKSTKNFVVSRLKTLDFYSAGRCILYAIERTIQKQRREKATLRGHKRLLLQYESFAERFDVAIAWHLPASIHNVFVLKNLQADRKVMWIHMDVSQDFVPTAAEKYYEQYDKICCVSHACKKIFDEQFPSCADKTDVFYNILDVERIRCLGREEAVGMDFSGIKIVTCGRISSQKQPLLAVSIAKELHQRGVFGFRWYFIGDGDLRVKLQEGIDNENLRGTIFILGMQENPYKYVSKADVFVQMSRHESFCLTLAEAQILGAPTVTTNFPSAYEIVEDGVTGYIVENNWMAICDKLELLISDKNRCSEMKHNLASYEFKANGSAKQLNTIWKE